MGGLPKSGEKIVFVIDALDEVCALDGDNVMGLPRMLPEGIYFIVSQRPIPVKLQVETPRTPCSYLSIEAEGKDNLDDIENFLKSAVSWPGISKSLKEYHYTETDFISILMEKCHGVWIYLNYVVYEIELGGRKPLDLRALPNGLTQYYANYWMKWRDKDEELWNGSYLPILSTLAVVREAITPETMVNLSNVCVDLTKLRRILKERWRPFLTIQEYNEKEYFRYYHATLGDFFNKEIDLNGLSTAHKAFIDEISIATSKANDKIIERYLDEWGGLDNGMPFLNDPLKQEIDEGYGLRNLSYHMFASSMDHSTDKLLDVILNPLWQQARRKGTIADSNLILDIEFACYSARAEDIQEIRQYIISSLLKAKLISGIMRLPIKLIEAYAKLGYLDRAVDLTDLIADDSLKASSFFQLSKWCIEQGDVENAKYLLKRFEDCLFGLQKIMPKDLAVLSQLFNQISEFDEARICINKALDLIKGEQDEFKKSEMIDKLLDGLNNYSSADLVILLKEIEGLANTIRHPFYKSINLASIAERYLSIDPTHSKNLIERTIVLFETASIDVESVPISKKYQHGNEFLTRKIGIVINVGLEAKAIGLMSTIIDATQRCTMLINFAKTLYSKKRDSEADRYVEDALELLVNVEGIKQTDLKLSLIELLLDNSNLAEAKKIASSIPTSNIRELVAAFCMIVHKLAQEGKVTEANEWVAMIDNEWGKASGKVAIGSAQIKLNIEYASSILMEAINCAAQVREGIVNSKRALYEYIAITLSNFASISPDRTYQLVELLAEKIQAEQGINAFEITNQKQERDSAIYSFIDLLTYNGFYDERVISNITYIDNSVVRNDALLLCIRAACKEGEFARAKELVEKIGGECWKLIGSTLINGWEISDESLIRSIIDAEMDRFSTGCEDVKPFYDPISQISIELGVAGHLDITGEIWSRKQGSIDEYRTNNAKISLVYFFAVNNDLNKALTIIKVHCRGYYKAKALAIVAAYLPEKNLSLIKNLCRKVLSEINPIGQSFSILNESGNYDEILIILARATARWDITEADVIMKDWITRENHRKKAAGEIMSTISYEDQDAAYSRLIDIIERGADNGLISFWEALAVCAEGIYMLIGERNILQLINDLFMIDRS